VSLPTLSLTTNSSWLPWGRVGGKYTGLENFAVIDFCLGNGMRYTRSYYGTLIAGAK